MITVYSSEGEEYIPSDLCRTRLEDCADWEMMLNLMRCLALAFLDTYRRELRVAAFFLVMWPVEVSLDVFL